MVNQQDNPNQATEKNEYLRTEYQVCQQSADGHSMSHWTFSGIFLGLITIGLVTIIPSIFSERDNPIFQYF